MMKPEKVSAWLAVGLLASGAAQATLYDRGGGLIYDDVLNITWLQDANYGAGSSYDNGGSTTDGRMTWDNAKAWADALSYYDNVRNVTYTDWRLPIMVPGRAFVTPYQTYLFSNNGSQPVGFGATGTGYGTATPAGGWGVPGDADGIWSELGWMYYHNLGNLGALTPDNSNLESRTIQPGFGLVNTNPFENLQDFAYWSGTKNEFPNADEVTVWALLFSRGEQGVRTADREFYAWAVRPGDVPEPGTLLLLGLGLVGLSVVRRNTSAGSLHI